MHQSAQLFQNSRMIGGVGEDQQVATSARSDELAPERPCRHCRQIQFGYAGIADLIPQALFEKPIFVK